MRNQRLYKNFYLKRLAWRLRRYLLFQKFLKRMKDSNAAANLIEIILFIFNIFEQVEIEELESFGKDVGRSLSNLLDRWRFDEDGTKKKNILRRISTKSKNLLLPKSEKSKKKKNKDQKDENKEEDDDEKRIKQVFQENP